MSNYYVCQVKHLCLVCQTNVFHPSDGCICRGKVRTTGGTARSVNIQNPAIRQTYNRILHPHAQKPVRRISELNILIRWTGRHLHSWQRLWYVNRETCIPTQRPGRISRHSCTMPTMRRTWFASSRGIHKHKNPRTPFPRRRSGTVRGRRDSNYCLSLSDFLDNLHQAGEVLRVDIADVYCHRLHDKPDSVMILCE